MIHVKCEDLLSLLARVRARKRGGGSERKREKEEKREGEHFKMQ